MKLSEWKLITMTTFKVTWHGRLKWLTHSHKAFVLKHVLETFLDKLVCPTNKIQIVYVIELQEACVIFYEDWSIQDEIQIKKLMNIFIYLCSYPGSKQPTCTTGTDSPSFDLLGVTPHEITKGALMRNFTIAVNNSDLIIK